MGWLHSGPAGSGHFVIMVHNGIEYGMMQGYAEGLSLTAAKTELGLDLAALTEMWHHGRVQHDSDLGAIEPHVADYGKAAGRCWKGWSWACLRR